MINIPVSYGELLDKISILEIKKANIEDNEKVKNVEHELKLLSDIIPPELKTETIQALYEQLFNVNLMLWQVEDDIRDCERSDDFGAHFVALARSVYRHNDRRSEIKRSINQQSGSSIVEEKSYTPYK